MLTPKASGKITESKLIPALDVASMDFTHDKLGFTINLVPDADPATFNDYANKAAGTPQNQSEQTSGGFLKKMFTFGSS